MQQTHALLDRPQQSNFQQKCTAPHKPTAHTMHRRRAFATWRRSPIDARVHCSEAFLCSSTTPRPVTAARRAAAPALTVRRRLRLPSDHHATDRDRPFKHAFVVVCISISSGTIVRCCCARGRARRRHAPSELRLGASAQPAPSAQRPVHRGMQARMLDGSRPCPFN